MALFPVNCSDSVAHREIEPRARPVPSDSGHSAPSGALAHRPVAAENVARWQEKNDVRGNFQGVPQKLTGEAVGRIGDDPIHGLMPRKEVSPIVYFAPHGIRRQTAHKRTTALARLKDATCRREIPNHIRRTPIWRPDDIASLRQRAVRPEQIREWCFNQHLAGVLSFGSQPDKHEIHNPRSCGHWETQVFCHSTRSLECSI